MLKAAIGRPAWHTFCLFLFCFCFVFVFVLFLFCFCFVFVLFLFCFCFVFVLFLFVVVFVCLFLSLLFWVRLAIVTEREIRSFFQRAFNPYSSTHAQTHTRAREQDTRTTKKDFVVTRMKKQNSVVSNSTLFTECVRTHFDKEALLVKLSLFFFFFFCF